MVKAKIKANLEKKKHIYTSEFESVFFFVFFRISSSACLLRIILVFFRACFLFRNRSDLKFKGQKRPGDFYLQFRMDV